MKKIESASSAAMAMKAFFQDDWKGFEFEEKATLIRTKEIKKGPAWMLLASRQGQKEIFVLEAVSRVAYPCPYPAVFSYKEATPSDETFQADNGLTGKVIEHNGEIAIMWE